MSPDAATGYKCLPLATRARIAAFSRSSRACSWARVMSADTLGLAAPLGGTGFAVAPPIGAAGPAKSPPEARIGEDRRRERRPRWAGGRDLQAVSRLARIALGESARTVCNQQQPKEPNPEERTGSVR